MQQHQNIKNIFFIVLCCFSFGQLLQAQPVLYGTASGGGANNLGVRFSVNAKTRTYTKTADFSSGNVQVSLGNLVQTKDGKLYGTMNDGGTSGKGTLFSYDFATGKYTYILDFDSTATANPNSKLMQASDGKLYGTTAGDEANNLDALFSFDPAIGTFMKVLDFDTTNAANVKGGLQGSLIEVSKGKLYGITTSGGNYSFGFIFSIDVA